MYISGLGILRATRVACSADRMAKGAQVFVTVNSQPVHSKRHRKRLLKNAGRGNQRERERMYV